MLAQSMEKLFHNGEIQGKIKGKQQALIKQLSLKLGLTEAEKQLIMGTSSRKKIERALELILFTEDKTAVLDILR